MRAWSRKRKVALGLLALPAVVYLPLRYWAFHVAGGWFVANDLEPEHRAGHLGEAFVLLFLALGLVAVYAALVLLYLDRFYRKHLAILMVLLAPPALAALGMLAAFVDAYFRFG